MDLSVYGTNPSYLIDFIKIGFRKCSLNPQEIRVLYLEQGLSASQIAERLDISKSLVIGWMSRLKINPGSSRGRSVKPENYRHPKPPYGYRVRDGKLVLDRRELKICRLIIELVDRQGLSLRAVGRELVSQGFRNRRGDVKWGHYVVQQIYRRWAGKL